MRAGSLSFPMTIPDDVDLVGLELTLQYLIRDLGAGPPAPVTVSASNGLALEIVF